MLFPAFEELSTSRLQLRRLEMEDVPVFFQRLGGNHNVTKYMLWIPHKDISESEASIQKALQRYESGQFYRWAICSKESPSLIGIIDLLGFDTNANTCSFAYMLGEDFWGMGYGTEALCAVLDFAFTQLQVDAVIAEHFADNPASGAVMRKAGMAFQQTIPGKYEKNGFQYDAIQYKLSRQQWLSQKHT